MRLIIFFAISISFCLVACNSLDVDRSAKNLSEFDLTEFEYFDDRPQGAFIRNDIATSDESAALGRLLFYDTQLSRNNNISCATCHKQAFAFGESKAVGEGLFNDQLSRNSTALTYAGFRGQLFWDARSSKLKDAVLEPITNHSEMAMTSMDEVADKLKGSELYMDLFNQAFGLEPNSTSIGIALSSFIGSMYSFDSKFDHGREVNFVNFTEEELRGKAFFEGRGNCDKCHQGINFDSYYNASNIGLDLVTTDEGRGNGRFRVSSLRNIDQSAPYMHDGRFETLEEVIEHYNSGVKKHSSLAWWLKDNNQEPVRLNMTDTEKSDLLAFLLTLSDDSLVFDERFSNPF